VIHFNANRSRARFFGADQVRDRLFLALLPADAMFFRHRLRWPRGGGAGCFSRRRRARNGKESKAIETSGRSTGPDAGALPPHNKQQQEDNILRKSPGIYKIGFVGFCP
jgi:hypothetical protein